MLRQTGSVDVIDAAIVSLAGDGDQIVTSDPDDLEPLCAVLGRKVELSAFDLESLEELELEPKDPRAVVFRGELHTYGGRFRWDLRSQRRESALLTHLRDRGARPDRKPDLDLLRVGCDGGVT
jgi:hypothetical protein